MQVTLIYLSGLIFIFYGLLCFLSDHMKREFVRYGLSQFRTLTGVLELLGGAGLLIGVHFKPLLIFSAAGLSLLMLLGVIVRVKTKDPIHEILPAFVLMILNFVIVIREITS